MECRLHARPAEQRCKEGMATASLPVIVPLVAKGLAFAVHDDEHETAAAMSAQPRRHYVTSFFHQGDQCTLANVSRFCRFLRDLRSHPRLAAREIVYFVELDASPLGHMAPFLLASYLILVEGQTIEAAAAPFAPVVDLLPSLYHLESVGVDIENDGERCLIVFKDSEAAPSHDARNAFRRAASCDSGGSPRLPPCEREVAPEDVRRSVGDSFLRAATKRSAQRSDSFRNLMRLQSGGTSYSLASTSCHPTPHRSASPSEFPTTPKRNSSFESPMRSSSQATHASPLPGVSCSSSPTIFCMAASPRAIPPPNSDEAPYLAQVERKASWCGAEPEAGFRKVLAWRREAAGMCDQRQLAAELRSTSVESSSSPTRLATSASVQTLLK